MRVAVVHSFYRSALPSGENGVVEQQVAALRGRGHDVQLISRYSDDIGGGPLAVVRKAVDVARAQGADPTDELRNFAPDVVHVHNLFPNFGTAWLDSWDGPVVATLHNYRAVCSAAVLSRDGRPCTLCASRSTVAAVRYGCYRGSRVASLPMAWRTRHGVAGDPLIQRADAVVVLSEVARELYRSFGVAEERLRLIPNGLADPGPPTEDRAMPPRFVAAGRISAEKGFPRLLAQWPIEVPLDVYGDGPLLAPLRAQERGEIRVLGSLPHDELAALLPRYTGLVIPGANLEGGLPMVMVEALAAGVPLVVRDGGVVAPVVRREGGGVVFSGADDLPSALVAVQQLTPADARDVYERLFTQEMWLDRLESVYRDLAHPTAP